MNWLSQFIDYKRISVLAFEKKIGVRSTVQKAIKGSSNLGSNLLAKIVVEFPEINPDWLITGNGEMLRLDDTNTKLLQCDCNKKINELEDRIKFYKEKIEFVERKLQDCEDEKKRSKTIS